MNKIKAKAVSILACVQNEHSFDLSVDDFRSLTPGAIGARLAKIALKAKEISEICSTLNAIDSEDGAYAGFGIVEDGGSPALSPAPVMITEITLRKQNIKGKPSWCAQLVWNVIHRGEGNTKKEAIANLLMNPSLPDFDNLNLAIRFRVKEELKP